MSTPGFSLEALIDYWLSLSRSTAARLRAAREDILAERYGSARLIADVVGFWTDSVEGWWQSFLRSTDPPVPVVPFTVSIGPVPTEAKAGSVRVSTVLDGQPEWTDVVRLGRPLAAIPRAHVRVALNESRDELQVSLRGLRELDLLEGRYGGLVYLAERPLAVVSVVVSRRTSRAEYRHEQPAD
jgi:hypothetical protein